jgi:hypothetical protein
LNGERKPNKKGKKLKPKKKTQVGRGEGRDGGMLQN